MIWQSPVFEAPYWTAEPRKGETSAPSVYEAESGPQKSGLVDSSGTPLFKAPEQRRPIGFHPFK